MTEQKRFCLWLDDDVRFLKAVEDFLPSDTVSFGYADSVHSALTMLGGIKHVPLLLFDAIVPISRGEEQLEGLVTGSERDRVNINWADYQGFSNLERRGLLFIKLCELLGVSFGKTVLISYVPERQLREMGYKPDRYISKLSLKDELRSLHSFIVGSSEGDGTREV